MSPNRPNFRIDLRSLFAWTTYAIFGLVFGAGSMTGISRDTSWTNAALIIVGLSFQPLLTAASAAIIIGLLKQVMLLRKQAAIWSNRDRDLSQSAVYEAWLRTTLAISLFFCLSINALEVRGIIESPRNDNFHEAFSTDIVTGYAWWLTILIALCDASLRTGRKAVSRRQRLARGFSSILASLFGIYLIVNSFYLVYLTHIACSRVDAKFKTEYQRYPVLTQFDQWLLSAAPTAAAAAIVIAAIMLLRALSKRGLSGPFAWSSLAPISLLLITSASYVCWYQWIGRDYFSPDFEDVGLSASWRQICSCAGLAALLLTFAVYRAWHTEAPGSAGEPTVFAAVSLPSAGEQVFVIAAVLGATFVYTIQLINAAFTNAAYFNSVSEALLALACVPASLVILAMLLQSAHLARLRWQGSVPTPLKIIPIRLREFAAAWLLLAAITVIAIPTFAALSLSFWLGLWYRW